VAKPSPRVPALYMVPVLPVYKKRFRNSPEIFSGGPPISPQVLEYSTNVKPPEDHVLNGAKNTKPYTI